MWVYQWMLSRHLSLESSEMANQIKTQGIPTDSIGGKKSEFQNWVEQARQVNTDIKIAIKADEHLYKIVKRLCLNFRIWARTATILSLHTKTGGLKNEEKESKQKEDGCPRRLYAYGGYDDASITFFMLCTLFGKATDYGVEYA